uniref:DNA-directed RNA polymerase n=1 Tax=viral metagenome TaxID=1070528 RepID=A0A6C0HNX2_9ZZZZ
MPRPINKRKEEEEDEEYTEEPEEETENEDDVDVQTESESVENEDSDNDEVTNDSDELSDAEPVPKEVEESDGEEVLQKFTEKMRNDTILEFHPESISHNYDEVKYFAKITRDASGQIIDNRHKTNPILTKYEKTRILGQRAKQLETGSQTFINPYPVEVVDSYLLAQMEFELGLIPFIIRRPLPGGKSEYWHLNDLEKI